MRSTLGLGHERKLEHLFWFVRVVVGKKKVFVRLVLEFMFVIEVLRYRHKI